MIQIDGLAEVVLNVRDASRAVAFYGTLLGLERMTPEGQPGPIFFRAGQATDHVPSLLVLVPLPSGAQEFGAPRALHHLALTIPAAAFDEARAALTTAGIEVRVLPITDLDPDGNEVEFISPETAG